MKPNLNQHSTPLLNQRPMHGFIASRHKLVRYLLVVLVGLALTGCTSTKRTTKVDDSVDYKSARTLPPLKQKRNIAAIPASPAAVAPQPQVEPTPTNDIASAPIEALDRDTAPEELVAEVVEEPAVVEEPTVVDESTVVEESMVVEESSLVEEPAVVEEPVVATVQEPTVTNSTAAQTQITAQVITTKQSYKRLQVNAATHPAWAYVREQAKNAGLSIFSRDVASRRLYIGCGAIPEKVTTTRKGGWTIFKRDNNASAAEYCSLKLTGDGDITFVSVLDKAGGEVAGESAEAVLMMLAQ